MYQHYEPGSEKDLIAVNSIYVSLQRTEHRSRVNKCIYINPHGVFLINQ